MLTATVIRCPVFGGKVAGLMTKTIPGVKHVVQIDSGVAVADSYWSAMKGARSSAGHMG
jgi:isoquinoline 1-oxidoreductase beta subunit